MGADWPNEADEPSEQNSNRSDSQTGGRRTVPAETRSRQEHYDDQRQAVSAVARRNTAEEQAQAQKWDKAAEESRWMWGEYQRRWPPANVPPVDTSADPPGSWRADGDRYLPTAVNNRVDSRVRPDR